MRRLIQAAGAEVIHLGHNRSVADVVRAAIQEDADAIALSSYQGGHVEYFRYAVDMLREAGAGHIRVFGGGGGTITAAEAAELEAYGVERVYSPDDGLRLGLDGDDRRPRRARAGGAAGDRSCPTCPRPATTSPWRGCCRRSRTGSIARRRSRAPRGRVERRPARASRSSAITGTGGAGKSTVTDEILARFLAALPRAAGRRASRSTRRGAAPAARCSATGSG